MWWIFSGVGSSTRIAHSGTLLQASTMVCSNSWWCVTKSSRCRLTCSRFTLCSIKIWRVWPSQAWSSAVTPSYNWYNASLGRATKFNPQLFMSPLVSTRTTSAGNTKVFVVWVCTIWSVATVSSTRFGVIPPRGHTCNSCNFTLSSPNTVVFFVISSSNAPIVTLCAGFLLSRTSFYKVFLVFDFLHVLENSLLCGLLPWVDFLVMSKRSCVSDSFCMSCPEEISWSSVISSVITS